MGRDKGQETTCTTTSVIKNSYYTFIWSYYQKSQNDQYFSSSYELLITLIRILSVIKQRGQMFLSYELLIISICNWSYRKCRGVPMRQMISPVISKETAYIMRNVFKSILVFLLAAGVVCLLFSLLFYNLCFRKRRSPEKTIEPPLLKTVSKHFYVVIRFLYRWKVLLAAEVVCYLFLFLTAICLLERGKKNT